MQIRLVPDTNPVIGNTTEYPEVVLNPTDKEARIRSRQRARRDRIRNSHDVQESKVVGYQRMRVSRETLVSRSLFGSVHLLE